MAPVYSAFWEIIVEKDRNSSSEKPAVDDIAVIRLHHARCYSCHDKAKEKSEPILAV